MPPTFPSTHLPPYIVIKILLAVFPMLYSHSHNYYVTTNLYFLFPSSFFTQPLSGFFLVFAINLYKCGGCGWYFYYDFNSMTFFWITCFYIFIGHFCFPLEISVQFFYGVFLFLNVLNLCQTLLVFQLCYR